MTAFRDNYVWIVVYWRTANVQVLTGMIPSRVSFEYSSFKFFSSQFLSWNQTFKLGTAPKSVVQSFVVLSCWLIKEESQGEMQVSALSVDVFLEPKTKLLDFTCCFPMFIAFSILTNLFFPFWAIYLKVTDNMKGSQCGRMMPCYLAKIVY